LAFCPFDDIRRLFKNALAVTRSIESIKPLNKNKKTKSKKMDVTLTIAYVVCFIVIFWLFFKTVNYFEKI